MVELKEYRILYPDKASLHFPFDIQLYRRGKNRRLEKHERMHYYNQLLKFHMHCIVEVNLMRNHNEIFQFEHNQLKYESVLLHHLNSIYHILYHQFLLYTLKLVHHTQQSQHWLNELVTYDSDISYTKYLIERYIKRIYTYKYNVIYDLGLFFPKEILRHVYGYL